MLFTPHENTLKISYSGHNYCDFTVNPKSLENLTPFQKGAHGNPRGNYKRTKHHARLIGKYLREKTLYPDKDLDGEETFKEITREEGMILGLIARAAQGDAKAYSALMDRWAGKVPDKLEMETRSVDEFASETEEQQSLEQWISEKNREAVIRSDEVLDEAKDIANGKNTDQS